MSTEQNQLPNMSEYNFQNMMHDMESCLTFHVTDKTKIAETVLWVWSNYHGTGKTPTVEVKVMAPNKVKVFIDTFSFSISWQQY